MFLWRPRRLLCPWPDSMLFLGSCRTALVPEPNLVTRRRQSRSVSDVEGDFQVESRGGLGGTPNFSARPTRISQPSRDLGKALLGKVFNGEAWTRGISVRHVEVAVARGLGVSCPATSSACSRKTCCRNAWESPAEALLARPPPTRCGGRVTLGRGLLNARDPCALRHRKSELS